MHTFYAIQRISYSSIITEKASIAISLDTSFHLMSKLHDAFCYILIIINIFQS